MSDKKPPLMERLILVGSFILDEIQKRWWDFQDDHFSKRCKVCGVKLKGFFGTVTTCSNRDCIKKFALRKHINSILYPNTSDKNRHI